MSRIHLVPIAAALALIASLSGCNTTSQPIAQSGSAAKTKRYYANDTPDTGSHIPRRYALDDTTKKPEKSGDNNATNILVDPVLAPKPAGGAGPR